ncbi:RTA1 like protein [Teratosphaeria destructans]|uniref:RTA1 like protein n=1 Tax=Teratosphaeria destructans TaxID=418781 RepID=A0A9W7SNW5_9PEZI|nr:RTA1 like protein [Teratosphaeria destructans]
MATIDGHGGWILWPNYTPSFAIAITFCITFAVLSVAHTLLAVWKRAGFVKPLVIGGVLEAIAYGCRAHAHYHPTSALPQSVDALFALVAPNFFAVTIFLYGARLIRASAMPKLSILSPVWMTRVFVGADVVSLALLVLGEGIYNGFRNLRGEKVGTDLVIAGLLVQLFNVCVFVGFAVTFHVRYARCVLAKDHPAEAKRVKRLLILTYKLCINLFGRTMFVLTLTGMGPVGFLSKKEFWIYVSDAAQMLLVMLFAFIWYFYDVDADLYESMEEEHVLSSSTDFKRVSDTAPRLTIHQSHPSRRGSLGYSA